MTYNGAGKTSDLREHREDHLASSPSTVTPAAPECQTPGQGDLDLRNDAGKNPELSTPLPLPFAPPTITQNKPLAKITSHENCSRVGGDPGGHSPIEKGSPVLPGFRLSFHWLAQPVAGGGTEHPRDGSAQASPGRLGEALPRREAPAAASATRRLVTRCRREPSGRAEPPDAARMDGQRSATGPASSGDAGRRGSRLPRPSAPLGTGSELRDKVAPCAFRALSQPSALVTGTFTCGSRQHRTEWSPAPL